MRKWTEVLDDVTALSESEKRELALMAEIVGAIVARRNHLGMTQRELADKCGIKQPVIARIESGAVTPRLDTLIKLAIGLGLKDFSIVFGEEAAGLNVAS